MEVAALNRESYEEGEQVIKVIGKGNKGRQSYPDMGT